MRTLRELFEYRQMIFSLVKKDLRGRYKASVLGFLWTFVNPLLQLLVYTVVFSVIMRLGIDKFYLFLFVALVPWLFFSACLSSGSVSVVVNQDLVKKIYFPRLVLPISYVTSCFVNMILSFVVVFLVLIVTGFGMNFMALMFLPIVMIVEYLFALGITLITSALTVYIRDLEHILGIVSIAWMYMTPVVYPADMVPDKYRAIFNLNPMNPIIEAYRDILYYKKIPNVATMGLVVAIGVVFVIVGVLLFNKLQKGFVEEL